MLSPKFELLLATVYKHEASIFCVGARLFDNGPLIALIAMGLWRRLVTGYVVKLTCTSPLPLAPLQVAVRKSGADPSTQPSWV